MAFHISLPEHIKKGRVTDVYFERVIQALRSKDINPFVQMEIRATDLPHNWNWAVFAGLEEVLELVSGLPVSVRGIPEGSVFFAGEPVFSISGKYLDFAVYETSILGLLCQASGIATNSARCRIAAGERLLISFGARRMHPAIAPMIERNAFIGGFDGVAVVESAELIGEKPMGTMSHSLVLCAGSERVAFELFDKALEQDIPRIALVDTFEDEKFGAIHAAEVLKGKLDGVRLDTPGSRRGNFLKILEEVRWELDVRGYSKVEIIVSGGIDEFNILELNRYANGYGIGTHISNSPVVNFSMDIVEIDGSPVAKRGKKSGLKQVWKCDCGWRTETLEACEVVTCERCSSKMEPLLKKYYDQGRTLEKKESPQEIRSRVLEQIKSLEL
ncbi:MAG: nicotinate phosphoribosyltransferase [Actinomycetota bacterium]|nr:nicotinate phosphoribosyltransferase [Actinomycetota bacterium]